MQNVSNHMPHVPLEIEHGDGPFELEMLEMSEVYLDDELCPRAKIDDGVVGAYSELLADGYKFPPVDVCRINGKFYLSHGWHRFKARELRQETKIEARVFNMTWDRAVLFSTYANAENGVHRSREDKKRSVLKVLNLPVCAEWSDEWIKRQTNTSTTYVASIRKKHDIPSAGNKRKYTRNGKTQAMVITNIGQRNAKLTLADDHNDLEDGNTVALNEPNDFDNESAQPASSHSPLQPPSRDVRSLIAAARALLAGIKDPRGAAIACSNSSDPDVREVLNRLFIQGATFLQMYRRLSRSKALRSPQTSNADE